MNTHVSRTSPFTTPPKESIFLKDSSVAATSDYHARFITVVCRETIPTRLSKRENEGGKERERERKKNIYDGHKKKWTASPVVGSEETRTRWHLQTAGIEILKGSLDVFLFLAPMGR